MRRIHLKISSTLEQVALADACTYAVCSLVLPEETAGDVQLCITEWLSNVIRHGCHNNPGHDIHLSLALDGEKVVIEIIDTGKKLPPGLLEKAALQEVSGHDIMELPEHGWGLYIIKSNMDEVNYRSEARRNILSVTKFYPT